MSKKKSIPLPPPVLPVQVPPEDAGIPDELPPPAESIDDIPPSTGNENDIPLPDLVVDPVVPAASVTPKTCVFIGGGTIGPIINGKRETIRFLHENGFKYITAKPHIAEWLRKNGYKEAN